MKLSLLTHFLNRFSIRIFLYLIGGLVTLSATVMLYSTKATKDAIAQNRLSDRVLFEAKLPHDFSIRDADIALRGYALTRETRFLFATIPRIRLEMETSFLRLDSILGIQGFKSKSGLAKIQRYKDEMRAFNDHQNQLVQLVQQGQMEAFMKEFRTDAGSNLWPSFVDAIEEVNRFELSIIDRYEFRARFSSMLAFWIQVSTFLLSSPLLFYIIIRLDREREQVKVNEEFRIKSELNTLKEKMLSVLSHEIRTPLNSIIGLSRVLATKSMTSEQSEIVTTIRRSSDHLLHLVNDILDFNKISANKLILESVPFNIREIVKQVINMYYGIARDKGLNLTYDLDDSIPTIVTADPTRLTQILCNLISNSIKFSASGDISISANCTSPTAARQATLTICIQDHGMGIDELRIATIFEPFSQGRATSTAGGTGLGLSIVQSLVHLMGGKIQLQSKVGEGTTFTIDIPVSIVVDPATTHDEAGSIELNIEGTHVLYIEDVPSNRYLVETLLIDRGVKCLTAATGEEAIERVTNWKFDAILLDIKLPDIDGLELLALIKNDQKSLNRDTPVIIFSAYTELSDFRINSVGADDFLCKPFDPDVLVGKIHKHSIGS